ncbi:TIGR03986 family CRISPR-associated RAMP protein [Picosynechococcus sp. NKBG042902]|uniref:TIGR03986 family type III CRISPR-associated RAMP protein n=1 Tax=Picosynechococcus sp. NKBG042902 TaxID=490193 RepID=UPI000AA96242|nr:TIGR03986 family CRISPR-associated RAMP protein [Picosynechococcus sp. NKBG042902]
MTIENGTLEIKTQNQRGQQVKVCTLSYISSDGQYRSIKLDLASSEEISKTLQKKIEKLSKGRIDVDFEEENGQILRLREQGEDWVAAVPDIEIPEQQRPTEAAVAEVPNVEIPERQRPIENSREVIPNNFHNPYNFVPALPRDGVTRELGDRRPVGHGRYLPEHWSGRLSVKLTTVTPLLIPDAAEMTNNADHKTYPVRLGGDGKPYLPPTSIKGMLRSAYEAITNSRLAILDKHDERLAYRMPAKIGLQMVPARIQNGQIHLYPGTSEIGNDGKPQNGHPMYAAWLPRYERNGTGLRFEVRYPDNSLPQHGDRVKFWAEKYRKQNFTYWKVRSIVRYEQELGQQPDPSQGHGQHQPTGDEIHQFEGYVYINNKNIGTKHDERIFITSEDSFQVPLTAELTQKWKELIKNYQATHEDEIRQGQQGPPAVNNARWSRHITAGAAARNLADGTLCYAHVSNNNNQYQVKDLYPVMITRGLYEEAPISFLSKTLKPATQKEQLSPADRVFGWVNQNGKGSYKGQLRVHSVTCQTNDPVENFTNGGFPLNILGQPKPQQSRFYGADDQQGRPIPDGNAKSEGYKYDDQGLRGRKVYPHHQGLPNGYWNSPTQDRTQQAMNGHYQEYRRPCLNGAEQRDNQNRSITGWVKPETEFTFDIDVVNLSSVELGGLLWLLDSPNIHYHRLGGAKPYGFGSVWLEIDWEQTDLRQGTDWQEFYKDLTSILSADTQPQQCIKDFQEAVKNQYKQSFRQVFFISAFCRASKGFDDNAAIRYPRIYERPNPRGESFEWFAKNDRTANHNNGRKTFFARLNTSTPPSFSDSTYCLKMVTQ